MNKNWILGFIEGEGSFFICGQSTPCFSIGLKNTKKNKQLLERMKNILQLGGIKFRELYNEKQPILYKNRKYVINSIRLNISTNVKNCSNFIDFLKPLKWHTVKYYSFLLWETVVEMISRNEHLTKQGTQQILEIKKQMNKSNNMSVTLSICNLKHSSLGFYIKHITTKDSFQDIQENKIDKNWLLGFIEAEGNFFIQKQKVITKTRTRTNNIRFGPRFQLGLKNTIENKNLLEKIIKFINPHKHRKYIMEGKINSSLVFIFCGLKNCQRLADFLSPLEWQTEKHQDFLLWKHAIEMIVRKEHRTEKGRQEILGIKGQMNKHDDKSAVLPEVKYQPLSYYIN